MEIPDTLDNFLKPLRLTLPIDKKQLPPNLPRQLRSIVSHFQNDRGNTIMFTGGSADENVLAAGLLASQLGKELYRINLSVTASRHLGETEKNLLQVFEFVDQHGFVLLIDEVDALFGKDADAEDERYANLEIAYLLKRIAAYSGMVVITSKAPDELDAGLLRAIPWQIDLSHHASRPLSLWQRFIRIFSKH